MRARAHRLRVNPTTAALEAGCARRLAYAFPRVRQVLGIDGESEGNPGDAPFLSARKTLQEIVVQLRANNAQLKRERDKAVSMAADLVIRMDQMKTDLERETRKSKRVADRRTHPYQVTGSINRLLPDGQEPE